jgi:hypothetical protein
LDKKNANPNVKFIYLIFTPNEDTDFSNEHIVGFENEINEDYKKTLEEISWFGDFKWLFDIIMEYQIAKCKSKSRPAWSFHYEQMDQNDYKEYMKQYRGYRL